MIALAFDNGFDVAVVFTKGTNALAKQTLARLNRDFKSEIEADLIHVFDVMSLPDPLAEYELQHKLIFVCKKEDDNIRRLDNAIFHTNVALASKRILLVDDEADFASIGFRRSRAEGIKINKIAGQLQRAATEVKTGERSTGYGHALLFVSPAGHVDDPSDPGNFPAGQARVHSPRARPRQVHRRRLLF